VARGPTCQIAAPAKSLEEGEQWVEARCTAGKREGRAKGHGGQHVRPTLSHCQAHVHADLHAAQASQAHLPCPRPNKPPGPRQDRREQQWQGTGATCIQPVEPSPAHQSVHFLPEASHDTQRVMAGLHFAPALAGRSSGGWRSSGRGAVQSQQQQQNGGLLTLSFTGSNIGHYCMHLHLGCLHARSGAVIGCARAQASACCWATHPVCRAPLPAAAPPGQLATALATLEIHKQLQRQIACTRRLMEERAHLPWLGRVAWRRQTRRQWRWRWRGRLGG